MDQRIQGGQRGRERGRVAGIQLSLDRLQVGLPRRRLERESGQWDAARRENSLVAAVGHQEGCVDRQEGFDKITAVRGQAQVIVEQVGVIDGYEGLHILAQGAQAVSVGAGDGLRLGIEGGQ